MTGKFTGKTGNGGSILGGRPVGGSLDINAADASFTWKMNATENEELSKPVGNGETATGPLSSPTTTAEGESTTVTNKRSVTGSSDFTYTGTNYTLTVTGTISGPPPPCTASGSWSVTQSGKSTPAVSGTWTIP